MTSQPLQAEPTAIYARTSYPTKAGQAGLAAQIDQCTDYAQETGLHVQEELVYQEITSGFTPLDRRKQFTRLLEAAQNHRFRVLLVTRHDRLSPESTLLEQALSLLRLRGVKVLTVAWKTSELSEAGKPVS